jgi:hypothetical protein
MDNVGGVSRRLKIVEAQHSAFSKLLSNTNKKTLYKVLLIGVCVRKISIHGVRARVQKMLNSTIPST